MSDQQDIVARLRAYTQNDRPVLSSDLKNAADYIEQLRHELDTALEHRNAARADADDVRKDRRHLATAVAEALDLKTVDLNVFVSDRDIAVAAIKRLRAERDCLRAKTAGVAAEGHRPGTFIPPTTTERFDEIERRIALLESSMRITMHRFDSAAAEMDKVHSHNPVSTSVAGRLRKALRSDDV